VTERGSGSVTDVTQCSRVKTLTQAGCGGICPSRSAPGNLIPYTFLQSSTCIPYTFLQSSTEVFAASYRINPVIYAPQMIPSVCGSAAVHASGCTIRQ